MAFISGGVAAILSAKVLMPPLRQLSIVIGAVSLARFALAMLLLEWPPVARLGEGGIERWIVYPAVLWLTVFGGALMGPAVELNVRDGVENRGPSDRGAHS
jgi:hypothetical protein